MPRILLRYLCVVACVVTISSAYATDCPLNGDQLTRLKSMQRCTISHGAPPESGNAAAVLISARVGTESRECAIPLSDAKSLLATESLEILNADAGDDHGGGLAICSLEEQPFLYAQLPDYRRPNEGAFRFRLGDSTEKSVVLAGRTKAKQWINLKAPISGDEEENAIEVRYAPSQNKLDVNLSRQLVGAYGQPRWSLSSETMAAVGSKVRLQGEKLEINASDLTEIANLPIQVSNVFGEMAHVILKAYMLPTYEDSTSIQSLRIELANARRLSVDEQYMKAEVLDTATVNRLSQLYDRALSSLPACSRESSGVNASGCLQLNEAQNATIRLISADIGYRKLLLEKGVSFWGGYRSLRPSTPHQELIKIRHSMDKLSAAFDRMERWQYRSEDKEQESQAVLAEKIYVMGQIQAETISAEIGNIEATKWSQVRATNAASIKLTQEAIEAVNSRMKNLAAQQDALTSQATSLLMSAAASASGLPLDSINAAAKGDLKKAVLDYATAELANPDSKLISELKIYSDVAKDIQQQYAELNEVYGDIQNLKDNLVIVADTARQPSIERLISIGGLVYSNLDSNQKKAIDDVISAQMPATAWIEAARQNVTTVKANLDELRQILGVVTQKLPMNGDVKEQLLKLMEEDINAAGRMGDAALKEYAARVIQGIGNIPSSPDSKEIAKVFIAALRMYPNLLQNVSATLWDRLRNEMPGASVETVVRQFSDALEAYVESRSPSGLVQIRTGGQISVHGQPWPTHLGHILQNANSVDPKFIRFTTKNELINLVNLIAQSESVGKEQLKGVFVAAANPQALTSYVAKNIPSELNEAIWEGLNERTTPLAQAAALGVKQATAGSLVATLLPNPSVERGNEDRGESSDATAEPQALQQQAMIGMALNAAFPGAGAAYQLAQSFASMDANRELNEQLSQQSAALMANYQEMVRAKEEAIVNEAIAGKEIERSTALAQAASAQLEQYNVNIDTILESSKKEDAKIRLYRPYFFYLAETLREQFDLFDRALAMWSGADDGRGFFERLIASDPSATRLALDSEIHLYDWLNRDREATKTDPYLLFSHWQQMVALAETYCGNSGCKPGDNRLGQLAATARTDIFGELASEGTKQRFLDWQKGDLSTPFSFMLTLDPSSRLVPDGLLNIRSLDWNIVASNGNRHIEGSLVRIRHLGHALIPMRSEASTPGVKFRNEAMMPITFSPSNRVAPFDLSVLSERFQLQRDIASINTPRALEGYGLFGAYEVTILNSPKVKVIDKLELEIAYVYLEPDNISSERAFVDHGKGPLPHAQCLGGGDNGAIRTCDTGYYFHSAPCPNKPPSSVNDLIKSSPGLDFIFATKSKGDAGKLTLCFGTIDIPVGRRAAELRKTASAPECTWNSALSDVRSGSRHFCK